MDIAHRQTDKMLEALEKRIAKEFRAANKEVQRKANEYFASFATEAEAQKRLLDAGAISKQEYANFILRKTVVGNRWIALRDTLAEDYHNANLIARKMSHDTMLNVYALNHNYAVYEIEHGAKISTSFTLYDHATVERLIAENPKLMPDPGKKLAEKLAANEDLRWNAQRVQSAITQSILQGEDITKAAGRLQTVTQSDYKSAVRNARTAVTCAQNAGRQHTYEEAEQMGVNLQKRWESTLDNRTRHEHRQLHGMTVPVNQPYEVDGIEIMYPGDLDCQDPGMIYNCRCTQTTVVEDYDRDVVKSSPKLGDMSYEEWLDGRD